MSLFQGFTMVNQNDDEKPGSECNIISSQAELDVEQETAMHHFRLSSWEKVDKITDRQICPNCGRKRMYFCYDCRTYVPGIERLAPEIELPVNVDIIKHWLERNGKSTAVHCQLLAPKSTRVFDAFTAVPDYGAKSNTVVVFPSRGAVSIDDYVAKNGPIRRLVVLDATWFTVKRLCRLPQLCSLPKVALKTYKTRYWRPQKGFSDEFLATIEAIYYAIRENEEASKKWREINHVAVESSSSDGPVSDEKSHHKAGEGDVSETQFEGVEDLHKFDDLLFWFYFFRGKVEPEKRKNNR